jgi:hypothetical protein
MRFIHKNQVTREGVPSNFMKVLPAYPVVHYYDLEGDVGLSVSKNILQTENSLSGF